MKNKTGLYWSAMIYGLIVTSLMLVTFVPKFIGLFMEQGMKTLADIFTSLFHWHDNPTGFVFAYMAGYALIWWKPLWGSVIIASGVLLFFVFNISNPFNLIFGLPTLLVAVLYILYWGLDRKGHKQQLAS
jgi:hypothetical protein